MIKRFFLAAFLLLNVVSVSASHAAEFDQAKIMKMMEENKDMSTELKGANMLIAYSELMAYLSGNMIAGMDESVRDILPQVEDLIESNSGSTNSELQDAIAVLKSQVLELSAVTNNQNTAVQNLSKNVVSMKNLNTRFPNAKFAAQLDVMIKQTQEFAANYTNYNSGIAKYAATLSVDQKSSQMLKALSQQREQITKYSFSQIGENFVHIGAVLRLTYGQ